MKLKYSLICDYANTEQSGKLNILGIFDRINAPDFPYTHPAMVYIAALEFHRTEAGKHRFKVCFADEDGKDIVPNFEGELVVPSQPTQTVNANLVLGFNGVVFKSPGTHQIDLIIDNNHIANNSMDVIRINK